MGARLHRFWRKRGQLALPGMVTLAAMLLLQAVGFAPLDRAGLLLFDTYQRIAPRPYEDAPVRIVDIDDETVRRLGQWPWPRTDMAELTRRLAEAGASTVAFDIVFSEGDRTSPARLADRAQRDNKGRDVMAALRALPDHDIRFAEMIQASPVVLGYFLTSTKGTQVTPKAGIALSGSPPNRGVPSFAGAIEPIAPLRDVAAGLGFVSLVGDSDGIIRKAPLIAMENGQLLPSLALEALRTAQGAGSLIVKASDGSGEMRGSPGDMVSLKVGDFEVPTTHAGQLYMYYTAPHPDRIVPAWKILEGKLPAAEMERLFAGRVVFVGTGAAGLRDLVSTPLQDRELGVMVHAQAIEQMVLGKFLSRPDWAFGLERTLLLALGLLLAAALPWLGAARGAVLGSVMVGGVAGGSWYAFGSHHFLLDPTYPVLGLIAVYLVETIVIYYREERQRAYIHGAFDRYLSPELVQRIVDDPSQLQLGGEEREMTVLFCDIRSFSSLSERLNPQEIIRFLIAFLTPMCDILLTRKATIDKFIGDAILAFWNAPLDDPDQHANAARGALAMVERLKTLNVEMPGGSEPWPGQVAFGIGLNSGPCCVGNMGSAQRLSYSLIGDTVNLTSRIEGLTKYYGVQIAIGSALEAKLPQFAVLPLDRVRVVGRDAPEMVHVLLGDEQLVADPEYHAFAERHKAMLAAYWRRDWSAAKALIAGDHAQAAQYGLAKYRGLMAKRVARFEAHPLPADWDGVYEAKAK